jgi:hypothetical protein
MNDRILVFNADDNVNICQSNIYPEITIFICFNLKEIRQACEAFHIDHTPTLECIAVGFIYNIEIGCLGYDLDHQLIFKNISYDIENFRTLVLYHILGSFSDPFEQFFKLIHQGFTFLAGAIWFHPHFSLIKTKASTSVDFAETSPWRFDNETFSISENRSLTKPEMECSQRILFRMIQEPKFYKHEWVRKWNIAVDELMNNDLPKKSKIYKLFYLLKK